MIPFHTKFPELAETETRMITTTNDPILPDAQYGFIESYCEKKNCDCRRVLINVISDKIKGKILATINYGWEDDAYYSKLLSIYDKKFLKGPYLDTLNPQSEYSKYLLDLFKQLLHDTEYVKRFETHYKLFKSALTKRTLKSPNRRKTKKKRRK